MVALSACSLSASAFNPVPQMSENDSQNGHDCIIHERFIALAFFKETASPSSHTQDDKFKKAAHKPFRDTLEDDDPICGQAGVESAILRCATALLSSCSTATTALMAGAA